MSSILKAVIPGCSSHWHLSFIALILETSISFDFLFIVFSVIVAYPDTKLD